MCSNAGQLLRAGKRFQVAPGASTRRPKGQTSRVETSSTTQAQPLLQDERGTYLNLDGITAAAGVEVGRSALAREGEDLTGSGVLEDVGSSAVERGGRVLGVSKCQFNPSVPLRAIPVDW